MLAAGVHLLQMTNCRLQGVHYQGPVPGTHEACLLFGVVGGLITDWDSGTWLRLRGYRGLGNAIPFNFGVDEIETRHHARLYNTIQYNV